jgi:hypothetical protein
MFSTRVLFVDNVINHRATHTTERRGFPATSKHSNIIVLQRVYILSLPYKMPLSHENRMQMAISAIKNQKIQSNRKAASIFSVPEPTLRARLRGRKPRSETRANGYKLTAVEEEVLVKRALDADKRGFAIRPQFLREMAHILLRERTQDPTAIIGVNWVYKFTNRQLALRTRYNRRIIY